MADEAPQVDDTASPFQFTFMLDGLGDPAIARDITARLHTDHGLTSRSDPAGMWLEVESPEPISEAFADRVVHTTSRFGLLARDRVGSSFVASVGKDQLRQRVAYEWTSRFATGLVFLLPALVLHYLTPSLAQGTRYLPHGIEAALVGWSIIAAAWPVMYQGVLSILGRRVTPDAIALVLIATTFAIGVVQTAMGSEETIFHVTSYAIIAITLQRMIIWRSATCLDGCGHMMLPSAPLLAVILVASLIVLMFDQMGGWSMLLATPVMLGALSINRLTPPAGAPMPVLLFVALLVLSPLFMDPATTAVRYESAFGFNVLITLLYGAMLGDRRVQAESDSPSDEDATEAKA